MSYVRLSGSRPSSFMQRTIHSLHMDKFGRDTAGDDLVTAAGRVKLACVLVPFQCTVSGVIVPWGSVAAGNVTVGITVGDTKDPPAPAGLALLRVSASTAAAGTDRLQHVPFTSEVTIDAGVYWIMAEFDAVTDKVCYCDRGAQEITGDINYAVYYDRGGYGALTDPVPAVTPTAKPCNLILKVVRAP